MVVFERPTRRADFFAYPDDLKAQDRRTYFYRMRPLLAFYSELIAVVLVAAAIVGGIWRWCTS